MDSRHLYSHEGHWIAFLVGEDLFWRDGERLGWLQRGGVVRSRGGELIGRVTDRGIIELWPQAVSQAASVSQQS